MLYEIFKQWYWLKFVKLVQVLYGGSPLLLVQVYFNGSPFCSTKYSGSHFCSSKYNGSPSCKSIRTTLVLAVELVPVVEALGTEELLGGHAVPVKLHQQGEPLLCPAQHYFFTKCLLKGTWKRTRFSEVFA